MQFGNRDGSEFRALRSAIAKAAVTSIGFSVCERRALASLMWEVSVRRQIALKNYVGAWHRVQAAAFGKAVLSGPGRILRADLEDEMLGLIASSETIMGFIHLLYHAMQHDKNVTDVSAVTGRNPQNTVARHPTRMAVLMNKNPAIRYLMAAQMAEAIQSWTDQPDRLHAVA